MFDWVLKTPLQNTYGSLSAKIVTDFPKKYWNSFFHTYLQVFEWRNVFSGLKS